MKYMIRFFLLFMVVITAVYSCRHEPLQTEDVAVGDPLNPSTPIDTIEININHPCDSDSVYFTNTILPLINNYCATADCHDAINPEENLNLTSYSGIRAHVQPGNLNVSSLWVDGIANSQDPMPPADSPQLTSEQRNLIRQWILQGALNNSCEEDCNDTDSSYSRNLAPIIDRYCSGCHGGTNPSDGFALENIAQLRDAVNNNLFMDALNGTNGVGIMPPNTTGLPDCYIQQFQNWINAGMPDN